MDVLANYIGCLHSEIECSHIINLAIHNNMVRLLRRLNEKEKRMIRPGYGFIYLEEESGIMRWTDSKSWTPSRALGPFMMYIEKRSENPLIKKIYSAKYQNMNVHIVIYNLLNHEETGICCSIYKNIKRNVLPEAYTTMSRCYLKRRIKKEVIDTKEDIKSLETRSICNDNLYFDRIMYSDIENDIKNYCDKPGMTMYKYIDGSEDKTDEEC